MRRLFALNRPITANSQNHAHMTPEERVAAIAAIENRQLAHAYMNRTNVQSQLHALYALEVQSRARVENAALEQSEAFLR